VSIDLRFPLEPAGTNGGPSPALDALRSADRLARITLPSGDTVSMVATYADVREVHSGPSWSRDLTYKDAPKFSEEDTYADPNALVNMDDPRHGQLRRLVSPLFTPARAREQRPLIQTAATDLLDTIVESGPGRTDLVESFALPLPVAVICAILGLDTADTPRLRRWSDAFLSTSSVTAAERTGTKLEFKAYIEALVAERRANPTTGVISELIKAADAHPETMTEPVLVRMISSLIVAGHETTAVMLGRAALTLLTNREWVDRAGTDARQWEDIVEELLRYDTPGAGALLRRSLTDQVLPSGRKVAAGEVVMAPVVAANNDPSVFPDPRRFDPQRSAGAGRHIAFGHGPHHCVGAALARTELQVALPALFARLPRVRLAVPASQLRWTSQTRIVALQTLPVAWG
jgi:cytochrome P450